MIQVILLKLGIHLACLVLHFSLLALWVSEKELLRYAQKIFDPEGTREVFYSKVIFATFGGHLVV